MKTCKVFFKNGESTEFLNCYFKLEYIDGKPNMFKIYTRDKNEYVGSFNAESIAGVGGYEV